MIPSTNSILSTNLTIERQPSQDYKLHIEQNTISGLCDGLDAMQQVIYKILNTERYENIIYSWNYGIELRDLFGKPNSYVLPELQIRITEALVQDDRISGVDEFEFNIIDKKTVHAQFIVHTIYGDIQSEKVVNL